MVFFSSPEVKALVSFSDQPLSIVDLSVNFLLQNHVANGLVLINGEIMQK
jgi:hypothetical protein